MASKKDFYLKFNVKDFMTDEKVRECSAGANGVYIHIICLLFNTETRGKYLLKSEGLKKFADILPKQNTQQTNKQVVEHLLDICLCVSSNLAKHLPFNEKEISSGLFELLDNNLLYLEGNFLCQKRMLRDVEISGIRSQSGKKGGQSTSKKKKNTPVDPTKKPENFADILPKQNIEQIEEQKPNYNSIYNNNYIVDSKEGVSNNMSGGSGEENSGEEKEDEKEIPKHVLSGNKGIELGYTSDEFKEVWKQWRIYLFLEHEKEYKSLSSEQAAIMHLVQMANSDEQLSIEIIKYSMANAWKSLNKKETKNGTSKPGQRPTNKPGKRDYSALKQDVAANLERLSGHSG